jgi:hypothetical protein
LKDEVLEELEALRSLEGMDVWEGSEIQSMSG